MKMINDYSELAIAIIDIDNFTKAERAIYKGTNCGASLQKIDNGVKIGSIVEGCAAETQYYDFTFPFDMCKFWETMTEIEKEAIAIYNEHVAVEETIAWEESHKYFPDGENS